MYSINRNTISADELEVKELERLLYEAKLRLRQKRKMLSKQGWVDWIFEYLGY
tara:strand:+ start:543 stop:701 length:159 start_codon:yes stop_codon:yes gene_type:complete